ncbi:hypothetical protein, partial [Aliarcobacter butzleri]|uniref:hypothetical protein n=1 Tax=Aliarcobacter butzleri TaxID=28197 RepID=UPI002B251EFC
NTAGSPCGNVGHRQLFKFFLKAFPKLVSITTFGEAFFLALPSPFYLLSLYLFQVVYCVMYSLDFLSLYVSAYLISLFL